MPTDRPSAVQRDARDEAHSNGGLERDHVAVLLTNIGLRISRGATAYYRANWDVGMVEWRLLMVLIRADALNVSELSDAATVDKAAASRSLAALQERELISIEQTRTRGRAAIVRLTPQGRELAEKLQAIGRQREKRLFSRFSPAEKDQLVVLLDRLTETMDAEQY